MDIQKRAHWDHIYSTKNPSDLSWTQKIPATSLAFIHELQIAKTAKILDVGGGESTLIDYLLKEGFENVSLLDISEKALEKTKARLGDQARRVRWIVSDITEFHPAEKYDLWHDRATFHFLTSEDHIARYVEIAYQCVNSYLTIGTFSDKGPKRCSGLPVKQYSEEDLQSRLTGRFTKIRCVREDHITPFHTSQNFLFCSFKRNEN
jgi:hypothetical protein